MLEIIALVFLTKQIGALAIQKGLKAGQWKFFLVLAWFVFEIAGFFIGAFMFGTGNLIGLALFALVCAFGGYLVVRAVLLKKPDVLDDDINKIGNN